MNITARRSRRRRRRCGSSMLGQQGMPQQPLRVLLQLAREHAQRIEIARGADLGHPGDQAEQQHGQRDEAMAGRGEELLQRLARQQVHFEHHVHHEHRDRTRHGDAGQRHGAQRLRARQRRGLQQADGQREDPVGPVLRPGEETHALDQHLDRRVDRGTAQVGKHDARAAGRGPERQRGALHQAAEQDGVQVRRDEIARRTLGEQFGQDVQQREMQRVLEQRAQVALGGRAFDAPFQSRLLQGSRRQAGTRRYQAVTAARRSTNSSRYF
ncbi:MAG: hypothetical protein IPK29_12730 [Betaproteobacteria bacterium]|nr:hypothetical protein [Betaproteobacteria bacterium]